MTVCSITTAAQPSENEAIASSEIIPGMVVAFGICFTVLTFRFSAIAFTALQIDQTLQYTLAALALIPIIGVAVYSSPQRYRPTIASLYFTVAIIPLSGLAFGDLGHIVSYLSRSQPFWDEFLARGDAALGFDWKTLLAWANQHPIVTALGYAVYMTATFQTVVIPVVLALGRQFRRLQVFASALMLSLIITYTIAGFMPALGTYEFYGIDPSQHPQISLRVASLHVPEIMGVRDGTIVNVSRLAPTGLVTFPSFHAATAVLFSWALWRFPYLRWFGLILNVLMFAFTPLHGSHFLVDVIAGGLMACAAIWLADCLRTGAIQIHSVIAKPILIPSLTKAPEIS